MQFGQEAWQVDPSAPTRKQVEEAFYSGWSMQPGMRSRAMLGEMARRNPQTFSSLIGFISNPLSTPMLAMPSWTFQGMRNVNALREQMLAESMPALGYGPYAGTPTQPLGQEAIEAMQRSPMTGYMQAERDPLGLAWGGRAPSGAGVGSPAGSPDIGETPSDIGGYGFGPGGYGFGYGQAAGGGEGGAQGSGGGLGGGIGGEGDVGSGDTGAGLGAGHGGDADTEGQF